MQEVDPLQTEISFDIDPSLTGRDRLRRLREIKSDLIKQVRVIERKRNELRKSRDEKNDIVRQLFSEAKELREKRDEVNEDVKLNKALRDLRKEDADQALSQLEELEEKMKGMGINPSRFGKKHGVARQIRELEKLIETTPNIKPQKEKEYIDKIEKLYQDIGMIEVADEKREEIRAIQKRLRTLRGEALSHHREVRKLASKSQEYHDIMLEKIREARKIRSEADTEHKEIIKVSEEIKGIRKEINQVSNEVDTIRKQLGEETAVERKKRRQAEAKQREDDLGVQATEILARYKNGEKLGFEEFKLLISRGLLKE